MSTVRLLRMTLAPDITRVPVSRALAGPAALTDKSPYRECGRRDPIDRWVASRSPITSMRRAIGVGFPKRTSHNRSRKRGGCAAESMKTGMAAVAVSAFSHRQSATPSTPGIIQSVTMRSGRSTSVMDSAAFPSSAVSTRYPSASRSIRSGRRVFASSSTRRMVATATWGDAEGNYCPMQCTFPCITGNCQQD
ncbi:hypothetical protein SAMN06266956_3078 [Paraburkholderia hospita]|nr:hypothetical protein SAMN06266956_3078 [Paraburkholderia hospita]